MDCPDHKTVSVPLPDHFSPLPVEILEKIGYEAMPADLINLRLTCNAISCPVFKPFVQGHFVERKHIFTERSLRNLIDITDHPVFGPTIRVVKLGLSHLREAGLIPVVTTASHMDENRGAALLALALHNLKRLGNTIDFGIFDCTNGCSSVYRTPRLNSRNPATEQLTMLLQAANLSRYDVKVLTMGHVDRPILDTRSIGHFRAELSKIKELNFECDVPRLGASYDQITDDILANSSPTKLRFEFATPGLGHQRLELEHVHFYRNLQELHLSTLCVGSDLLLLLLRTYQASLRTLTLENIQIISLTWIDVLEPLVSFPKLQRLQLSKLHTLGAGFWQFSDCHSQGKAYRDELGNYYNKDGVYYDEDQFYCVLGDTYVFIGYDEVRNGINNLLPGPESVLEEFGEDLSIDALDQEEN